MSDDLPYRVEYSKSGRSKCKNCKYFIPKDRLRIGTIEQSSDYDGKMERWHHVNCFFYKQRPKTTGDFDNFDNISWEDQEYIKKKIGGGALKVANANTSSTSSRGYKRNNDATATTEEENIPPEAKKIKLQPEDFKEEKDLQNQQIKFFDLRDKLSKLKKKELIKMLEANNQRIPVGQMQILDALVDALLFGALEPCPKCSHQFKFKSGTGYKCTGFVSEWLWCENIIQDPKRKTFVIPKDLKTEHDFLENFEPVVQRRLLKIAPPSVSSAVKKHSFVRKQVNSEETCVFNLQDEPQYLKDLNEKMNSSKVKLRCKGGGTVDPDSSLGGAAHVYQRGDEKFTVTLGNTDIQMKKNSFYKMQILKHDKEEKYWLFRRWGRIGTDNGSFMKASMPLEKCIRKFKKLYEDKSGNQWSKRDDFVKEPQKMYPIDIEDGDIRQFDLSSSNIKSKLKKPVQDLVRLIFDIQLMQQAMLEYEIDMEYMPLGKISEYQIDEAQGVLSQLWDMLLEFEVKDKTKYIEASNKFYTLIPHIFGEDGPVILDTEEKIAEKCEMLDCFREMNIAYKLLYTEVDPSKNPLDAHYEQLNTKIDVLDRESDEFKIIEKYVKNTHAVTHRFAIDIQEIFTIERNGEKSRYKPFEELHNRKLLWHGSRITNCVGILSQGLRIAPPEAPRTGLMFGKGIYFADMVSKSAKFCAPARLRVGDPVTTGLVLLSEVALGAMYETYDKIYIEKLPHGYHSTWARGKTQPDPEKSIKLEGGVEVPCGCRIPVTLERKSVLQYNEFIVYDEAQVKVKYLVKMKLTPESADSVSNQSAKSIFDGVTGIQKSIFGGTQFSQNTPATTALAVSGPPIANIFGGEVTPTAISDTIK